MVSKSQKILAASCAVVLLVAAFVFLRSTGPMAIRPALVSDPILRPTIQAYADAVDANPSAPKPRMELGMTYEGANMDEIAEQTYKQYVELYVTTGHRQLCAIGVCEGI